MTKLPDEIGVPCHHCQVESAVNLLSLRYHVEQDCVYCGKSWIPNNDDAINALLDWAAEVAHD